jgi:hypothetical protein
MTVKKEEFLALKQGSSSISEYRDRFLQLSRYAPEDVNTDAKRQYRFLRGLVSARSVDPSLEAAIVLVSQAINISSSGRTSVHLSISSSKGSTLSTRIRTVRAISQEVSFRGRISRNLVFLPQQPRRTVRQHQLRLETEHVSTVESKAIG